ncbi:MAG TPA: dephospho-CoA kinase [Polyangiaceae bacterium]|nr:dephospho-CoA kinase [Polyangiaceae bacterium]
MALQLFGLTGGIGSGKSTVARRFRARGLPVLDADQLARDVVAKGTTGLAEIVARFGEGVLDADGSLDRKKLAALVFKDDEARKALNIITHPRVGSLLTKRAEELARRGEPLACYEVPLLFETGLDTVLRPVVVVAAPLDARVERTMVRDAGTEDDVTSRVRAQMPLEEKVRRADYVIDNAGAPEDLVARADEVFESVCERLGVKTARYPRP